MAEFPRRNFSLASVKSGWLRGLGHFAKASLPLLDQWRRPSERTTDCRMTPIWPEHHWQLSTSGGSDCVGVSEWTENTFSIKFKRSDYLTRQQLCLLIEFDRFYLEFDFWQTLRCILQKLHTIVWNTCGYHYVKLYLIPWSFTHGIAKSLGGSLFFWTQCIIIIIYICLREVSRQLYLTVNTNEIVAFRWRPEVGNYNSNCT